MVKPPGLCAEITAECGCGWLSELFKFRLHGGVWRGGRVIKCEACGSVMEATVSIEDIGEKGGEDG